MKRRIAAAAVAVTAALAAAGGAVAVASEGHGGGDGGPRHIVQHESGRGDDDDHGIDNDHGDRSSVRLSDRDDDARKAEAARTTAAQAADSAHRAVKGTVTSVELENGRQGLVWEADVIKSRTAYEVVLDDGTGKVLAQHRDNDADD